MGLRLPAGPDCELGDPGRPLNLPQRLPSTVRGIGGIQESYLVERIFLNSLKFLINAKMNF